MSVCAARLVNQGVLGLLLGFAGGVHAADAQALFNGRNLDGWVPKVSGYPAGENAGQVFRVEDGLLKVRYDSELYAPFQSRFGHLFYETPFSHYALRVVYRFVGEQANGGPAWAERNSGVMLHAQPAAEMALNQPFPVAIEAQFLGGLGNGESRPTASVCTPGTHIEVDGELYTDHCLSSDAETYDGDQWVEVTITVLGGGRIIHRVNGREVASYSRPQIGEADPAVAAPVYLSSGYIALQSESHPIDFKVVEIVNLVGCTDPEALNYRPYALKRDSGSCRYR